MPRTDPGLGPVISDRPPSMTFSLIDMGGARCPSASLFNLVMLPRPRGKSADSNSKCSYIYIWFWPFSEEIADGLTDMTV